MDGNQLASVLVKMATSPVKADRDAIARIERECQTDVLRIAATLEESEIVAQAINAQKPGKGFNLLATGLFWSSVIGIATMFIRPSFIWYGVSMGFVAGIAGRIKS